MDFAKLREKMVYEQIFRRGIDDQNILNAFTDVERHLFVPEDKRSVSYEDYPIPLSCGQTISQPYMVALMIKALCLSPGMKVLEIGTGSGYQAAVLCAMGADLYTIEINEVLAKSAQDLLKALGYNCKAVVGDGGLGWPEQIVFDRIIVSAATDKAPKEWGNQLKSGGLIVAPIGGFLHQYLAVFEKQNEYDLIRKDICQCVFVPLSGKYGRKTPEE